MKLDFLVTSIFVGAFTFVIGALWSILHAYVLNPPDPKFGQYGAFQVGIILSSVMSVAFAIAFLATIPLYACLFRGRSFRHLVLYGLVFAVVLSAAVWSDGFGFL